ncbi:MAG: hypothetical protein EZS28_020998 [Streblomastix strix]|uniref:Uncharacterized protein n=1 Tax=Streblomastix strix TaxID=222440 RepID=A0A5J4VLY8_9EUKA|nr:MAG: hypothetical protein EZS28_020998 [Streblomastix strix]
MDSDLFTEYYCSAVIYSLAPIVGQEREEICDELTTKIDWKTFVDIAVEGSKEDKQQIEQENQQQSKHSQTLMAPIPQTINSSSQLQPTQTPTPTQLVISAYETLQSLPFTSHEDQYWFITKILESNIIPAIQAALRSIIKEEDERLIENEKERMRIETDQEKEKKEEIEQLNKKNIIGRDQRGKKTINPFVERTSLASAANYAIFCLCRILTLIRILLTSWDYWTILVDEYENSEEEENQDQDSNDKLQIKLDQKQNRKNEQKDKISQGGIWNVFDRMKEEKEKKLQIKIKQEKLKKKKQVPLSTLRPQFIDLICISPSGRALIDIVNYDPSLWSTLASICSKFPSARMPSLQALKTLREIVDLLLGK